MNVKLLELDAEKQLVSAYDLLLDKTVVRMFTGYEVWHAHRKEDAAWRAENNIPESWPDGRRPYSGALQQVELPDGSFIVVMGRYMKLQPPEPETV